jgi:hypothetical protein
LPYPPCLLCQPCLLCFLCLPCLQCLPCSHSAQTPLGIAK